MNDSMMPPPGAGGRKTMIFLLAGGVILMAAAGIVLFLKGGDDGGPAPRPQPDEAPVAVKPLVSPNRPPSHLLTTDTAPAADTETAPVETDPEKPKRRVSQAVGTVDAQAVNSYINLRFGQVKACYERRLKVNPFLEGKLDLNIGISPSGKVSAVTVNSDTVRDAEMLSCVKTTIRGWDLPKPQGGRVVIAKTFNFKKKGR